MPIWYMVAMVVCAIIAAGAGVITAGVGVVTIYSALLKRVQDASSQQVIQGYTLTTNATVAVAVASCGSADSAVAVVVTPSGIAVAVESPIGTTNATVRAMYRPPD